MPWKKTDEQRFYTLLLEEGLRRRVDRAEALCILWENVERTIRRVEGATHESCGAFATKEGKEEAQRSFGRDDLPTRAGFGRATIDRLINDGSPTRRITRTNALNRLALFSLIAQRIELLERGGAEKMIADCIQTDTMAEEPDILVRGEAAIEAYEDRLFSTAENVCYYVCYHLFRGENGERPVPLLPGHDEGGILKPGVEYRLLIIDPYGEVAKACIRTFEPANLMGSTHDNALRSLAILYHALGSDWPVKTRVVDHALTARIATIDGASNTLVCPYGMDELMPEPDDGTPARFPGNAYRESWKAPGMPHFIAAQALWKRATKLNLWKDEVRQERPHADEWDAMLTATLP